MDSSYLKLISGNRLSSYLGLNMDAEIPYRFPSKGSHQYAYVDIPVRNFYFPSEDKIGEEAKKGQYIQVIPACTVNVRGNYRFEVHPNKELWSYGIVQGMYYLEPEEGTISPKFYIHLKKDLSISDIEYAVRIYMRS